MSALRAEDASVGEEIRALRIKKGISQFRLARMLGVTNGLLSDWELAKQVPTSAQYDAVIAVLRPLQRERAVKAPNGSAGRERRVPASPSLDVDCCAEPISPTIRRPSGIALFAGAGGLAKGFEAAGVEIYGFVEADESLRPIFKANFPNARCLAHDVRQVDATNIGRWLNDLAELDVLFGGPPCQGFSLAGKRDRGDERNQLYREVVRITGAVRPRSVVVENVRLMSSMRDATGRLVIETLVDELRALNYHVSVHEVNAQRYGVPQFRERIFVTAVRADLSDSAPTTPEPAHGEINSAMSLFAPALQPYVTFRDATRDLEPLEAGEWSETDRLHWAVDHPAHVVQMLKPVPEGMSAHDNADPGLRPKSGYNTTYKRLRWDEPCSTVGTTFGMISASRNVHPRDARSITIREAARCQTFPDDYIFGGTWSAIRTAIGNAVPPRLAENVARHILRYVSSGDGGVPLK